MVVDHTGRLHIGIDDGGTDELEAALGQVLRNAVRQRRLRGAVAQVLPCILDRLAIDVGPKERRETAGFVPQAQVGLRVRDGGGDLEPVAEATLAAS
jgi:hypothetical protein